MRRLPETRADRRHLLSGVPFGVPGTSLFVATGSHGTLMSLDHERKWQRILAYLARGGRLTRFDAEKLGDHALNTTVANLGKRGITVSREPWLLVGRYGEIRCKRYWLEPDERQRALGLLERS